jgi:hypothetical protein
MALFTIADSEGRIPAPDPKIAAYKLMAWANAIGRGYRLTVAGDLYRVDVDGCEPTIYVPESKSIG